MTAIATNGRHRGRLCPPKVGFIATRLATVTIPNAPSLPWVDSALSPSVVFLRWRNWGLHALTGDRPSAATFAQGVAR